MTCAICRREAIHYFAIEGANVCHKCAMNILSLVVGDSEYRQLLLLAAVMTHRQELEEES